MGVRNKHFDLSRQLMHFICVFYLDKLLIFFAGEKGSCLGALSSSAQKPPARAAITFVPGFPLLMEELPHRSTSSDMQPLLSAATHNQRSPQF